MHYNQVLFQYTALFLFNLLEDIQIKHIVLSFYFTFQRYIQFQNVNSENILIS